MFFSETILTKKGPLAKIWLAAHWERKLSKTQFLQTNIPSSVSAINDTQDMALRLSGQLLLGICRIFSRKTRYLLEDCNEALLTLKMAFRPGVVDMVQEQTANINMTESMNEFDIFMSDTPLDLASLMQPKAVAQLPNDQTFISFSQSTLDPLDEVSFEVGRDAQPPLPYSPAKDSTLDHSLMKESFMSMEIPRNEQDDLGDQGVLDFGFDNNDAPPPMVDDFDIYQEQDPIAIETNMEIPMVAAAAENDQGGFDFTTMDGIEVPSVLADMTMNTADMTVEPLEEANEKTPTKKRVTQQRKRKNLVDSRIELTSEFLKSQLKDTSDIETIPRFVPVSRAAARLQNMDPKQFLELKTYPLVNPDIFEQVEFVQPTEEPSFLVDDGGQINYDDFPRGFGDVSAIHGESFLKDPSMIDEPSSVKKQKTEHNDMLMADDFDIYQEAGQEENLLPEISELKTSIIDFENVDELDEGKGLTNNAVKTLNLLEEKCKEGGSFLELAQGSERPVVAKLFFEILVLKTRDLVTVKQDEPYGDIRLGIRAA